MVSFSPCIDWHWLPLSPGGCHHSQLARALLLAVVFLTLCIFTLKQMISQETSECVDEAGYGWFRSTSDFAYYHKTVANSSTANWTVADPPQSHSHTDSQPGGFAKLTPAWRFRDEGMVECMLQGDRGSSLLAVVKYDKNHDHYIAFLPRAEILDDGRWPNWAQGPAVNGTVLAPSMHAGAGPVCSRIHLNLDLPTNIRDISLHQRCRAPLSHQLSTIPYNACPHVVLEATDTDGYTNNHLVADGPPAVVRVNCDQLATQRFNTSLSKGTQTVKHSSRVSNPLLHRCTTSDSLGRWLPIERARQMVINGDQIPSWRKHYWVPYGCRSTYWDIGALEKVSASGGKSTQDSELQCNLDAFKHVILTGVSTTNVLFASMRHHIFNETAEAAKRNKKRDQELQALGKDVMTADYDLGNGNTIMFVVKAHMMPHTQGRTRKDLEEERRAQIEQYVSQKPSAMVLHIGVHEFCGAFGPRWFTQQVHVPCASRQELVETYEDFGKAVVSLNFQNKTLFRSLMGSFPLLSSGNPCPSILGPYTHASFVEGDAPKAWAGSGVGFIDAFSPIHASTTGKALPDGLHTGEASDEGLAVNQLIMNALCMMNV